MARQPQQQPVYAQASPYNPNPYGQQDQRQPLYAQSQPVYAQAQANNPNVQMQQMQQMYAQAQSQAQVRQSVPAGGGDVEIGTMGGYTPPDPTLGMQSASMSHHSECVQMDVSDATDALRVFGERNDRGKIPVVLVPKARSWFSPTISVPTGCYCLMQRFGAVYGENQGISSPGLHFLPAFYRTAYVVTRQACTYNAPVKQCPTLDNVRVNVDLVVVFMIRDPGAFVYKMGAGHFNTLMSGAIQETMRLLVREQTYDTIFLLRGSRCDSMITKLNSKFNEVGVNFNNVTITSVHLPPSLRQSLENKTKMNKVMQKIAREHEFELGEIKRKSEMEIQTLKRQQESGMVVEQGKLRRAELYRQESLGKADENRKVALIQADEKTKVEVLEAKAELQRTHTQVEQFKLEKVSKAKADAEAMRVKAEVDKAMMLVAATGEAAATLAKAKEVEFQSVTEAANTQHLKHSRRHELEMKEKSVLGEMAASGKGGLSDVGTLVSMDKPSSGGGFSLLGANGDGLINALTTGHISLGDN